jgi:hypothetical protein
VPQSSRGARRREMPRRSAAACPSRQRHYRVCSAPDDGPGLPTDGQLQESDRAPRCRRMVRRRGHGDEGESPGRGKRVEYEQQGRPPSCQPGRSRLLDRGSRARARPPPAGPLVACGASEAFPGKTRDTTVVSQPPRLSMLSELEPFRRIHVSCTASSASVADPSMR